MINKADRRPITTFWMTRIIWEETHTPMEQSSKIFAYILYLIILSTFAIKKFRQFLLIFSIANIWIIQTQFVTTRRSKKVVIKTGYRNNIEQTKTIGNTEHSRTKEVDINGTNVINCTLSDGIKQRYVSLDKVTAQTSVLHLPSIIPQCIHHIST